MKSKQEFKKAFVRKSFSEYAELIKEHFTPSKESSLPYIGLEHIEQGTLRISSIGKSSDVTSKKFKFKKNDILFGKLRPYFRKVVRPNFDGVCSTDIFVVRAKEEFSQTFLYYLMASQEFVNYSSQGSQGTKMPRASWDFLEEYEQGIPSLEEQEQIGKTLSDLDTKIQNLHNQNHTLEQTAQAIFQSWFVDFDGVTEFEDSELGKIPKGWEVSNIGKKLEVILGGTPSRNNESYWKNGSIPWINSGKINEFRIMTPSELITEEGLKKSATRLIPKRTTVLAITGATLGQVSLLEIDSCANQSVIAIKGNDEIPSEYIYYYINSVIENIISSQTGGAQQHINRQNVYDANLLVPKKEVMEKYFKTSKPILDIISDNCFQIISLTKTRDALLPKLMSGEIRV